MQYNFSKIYGMLVYVSLQEAVKSYAKPGTPVKPPEWKASVVLTDEDYVDALEDYAKSLDTQISLKKVKTAEFENIYKVAPPEGAGKNVWILTLRKSTELGKTGKPVPDQFKPVVFEKVGKTMVDVTRTKLVGNGSIGAISVDKFDRTAGGSSLYLKNVLVTELKEYVKTEGYKAGSEFDDDDAADDGDGGTVKVPAAAKAKAKANKEAATDNDDPF
jgi:hypothetical protein